MVESAIKFFINRHQAEKRGLVTAPGPPKLKRYNVPKYWAEFEDFDEDDLATYNRMTGYHNDNGELVVDSS